MVRVGSVLSVALVLAACSADDGAPGPSPPRPPFSIPGVSKPDGSLEVRHERELRGAWISTVYNGTWPSRTGLSEEEAKSELVEIFDALAGARMNALFFQVRAESDAVYRSSIEPWSRFLTGTQGQDPGWDPLAFAIEEGHRRGLEVHAWLNPYRALVDASVEAASSHVSKTLASATRRYGSLLWLDPGAPEVRRHVADVVRDILRRYDVDGVHFDDYFYPYPVSGQSFDDAATYGAYTSSGGKLSRDDWRRSNVDALVREISELVASERDDVRFGISPFGIYRPGTPPGITGLDAYATLYCDPVRWMDEGWVDYLVPQLYWPTTQTAQAFGKLVDWWAGLAHDGRSIFVGHDATKAGQARWSLDEYEAQMTLTWAQRARGVRGSVFFSAKPLVTDQAGLRTTLASKHWTSPAAPPPFASVAGAPPAGAPAVTVEAGEVVVTGEGRSVAVYREEREGSSTADTGGGEASFALERLVPLVDGKARTKLDRGRWAVSVIDRRSAESLAWPVAVE